MERKVLIKTKADYWSPLMNIKEKGKVIFIEKKDNKISIYYILKGYGMYGSCSYIVEYKRVEMEYNETQLRFNDLDSGVVFKITHRLIAYVLYELLR